MRREPKLTRRDVLRWSAWAASGAVLAPAVGAAPDASVVDAGRLPQRAWGKLKRPADMLWLGTSGWRGHDPDRIVPLIRHALARGVRFIDTAHSYGSEGFVGQAIRGRRDELFIMTKTTQRGYDGAMQELEESLERLGTDRVELWKVHSIGLQHTGDEEVEHLRKPDGVMKAMRKMKEQGVVKHIGFTGHTDPAYMLKVIDWDVDGEFDTMLFTISAALAKKRQRDWEDKVLPAGRKKNYGLIAMKVFGAGQAVGAGPSRATPAELLKYVYDLGLPSATIGVQNKAEIDAAVDAVQNYAAQQKQTAPQGASTAAEAEQGRFALRSRFVDLHMPFEQAGYIDGAARG